MSPYLITGLAAVLLGIAIGAGTTYELEANHYGALLSAEKAAHAKDNEQHAEDIAKINAASATALAAALAKQQAAEGQVASIETQFNTEVANHAKDSLDYRAQLASGAQRLRVHVTTASCGSGAAGSQSALTAGGPDDPAAYADLDPTTASGVVQVAADDQHEIDKLKALQDYVRSLQDQGYITKPGANK